MLIQKHAGVGADIDESVALSAATMLLRGVYPEVNADGLKMALKGQAEKGSPKAEDRMLKVREFCSRCQISRPTLFRWLKEGRIAAFRLGGVLRVPESEIYRLVKGVVL